MRNIAGVGCDDKAAGVGAGDGIGSTSRYGDHGAFKAFISRVIVHFVQFSIRIRHHQVLAVKRIGLLQKLDIFLQNEVILLHIRCMGLADIAVVPRFVLDIRDILLAVGVAQNDAVLSAMLVDPAIDTGAVVLCISVEIEIDAQTGLVLTETGLCHTLGIVQTRGSQVFIIELLLQFLRTIAGNHNDIVIAGCRIEIVEHIDQRICKGLLHQQIGVTHTKALGVILPHTFELFHLVVVQADKSLLAGLTSDIVVDQDQ